MTSSDPGLYPTPWDPSTGCQACCSGEPFPSEPLSDVSTVSSL